MQQLRVEANGKLEEKTTSQMRESGCVLENLALGAHVLERARRIEDDLVQVLDLGMPKRASRVAPLAVLGATHRLCEGESARVTSVCNQCREGNMYGLGRTREWA